MLECHNKTATLCYSLLIVIFICGIYHIVSPFYLIPFIAVCLTYIGSIRSLKFMQLVPFSTSSLVMTNNTVLKYFLYGNAIMIAFLFFGKKIDMGQVNTLANLYFSYLATMSLRSLITSIFCLNTALSSLRFVPTPLLSRIKLLGFTYNMSLMDTVGFGFAGVIVLFYNLFNSWISNNLTAYAFIFQILQGHYIGSYGNGLLMFIASLVYNLFWLYATDIPYFIMTRVNIPIFIKLPYVSIDGKLQQMLMGIGDIIIPAIFLSFILRFEMLYHMHRNNQKECTIDECPKPIFHSALLAYFVAISVAVVLMMEYQISIPGIVLSIPLLLFVTVLVSAFKGQCGMLCGYNEETVGKEVLKLKK